MKHGFGDIPTRNKVKSIMQSFNDMGPIITPQATSVEMIDTTGILIRDMKEIATLLKEYDEFLNLDTKEALNETICNLSHQINKLAEKASLPMFKVRL